jgi:hypothetical protein
MSIIIFLLKYPLAFAVCAYQTAQMLISRESGLAVVDCYPDSQPSGRTHTVSRMAPFDGCPNSFVHGNILDSQYILMSFVLEFQSRFVPQFYSMWPGISLTSDHVSASITQ